MDDESRSFSATRTTLEFIVILSASWISICSPSWIVAVGLMWDSS